MTTKTTSTAKVVLHKEADGRWIAMDGRYVVAYLADDDWYRIAAYDANRTRRGIATVNTLAETREAIDAYEASDGRTWWPQHAARWNQ